LHANPEPVYVLESVRAKWWFTIGVGCGVAITALIVGLYAWRHARSSRWDERSLTVAWSEADEMMSTVRGGGHAGFVLDYGLQNNTAKDMTVPKDTVIMKRLSRGHTLTKYVQATLDSPSFIPAHQSAKVSIWLTSECSTEDLQVCLNKEFADSDGLVLFDHSQRMQVNLPKPALRP
jgi:hypothetical protein